MNPNYLLSQLQDALKRLEELNSELEELSYRKTESEKYYKIEKAKLITKLRMTGTPIGIIKDIAEGEERIAELEQEKKINEDKYYITLSAIENLRIEIESIRTQITWIRTEILNS